MKSTAYVLGFICVIVITFVILVIIETIMKKRNTKVEFDERQIAKRGEAYKTGFKAVTICEILEFFNEILFGFHIMDGALLHLSILLIGILAFVIHAIWNDAYFTGRGKKKVWLIVIITAVILNLLCFFCNDISAMKTEDGLLSYGFTNLEAAIFCFIIFVNIVIKLLIDRKTNIEE